MPRAKKAKPVRRGGRQYRDPSGAGARLVIRLTAAETERLRVLAGTEPLSAWARARLLAVAR